MAEQYTGEVKEIIVLSETAKAIKYKLDRKVDFLPGQFFMIETNLDNHGFKINNDKPTLQKRAFSISSSPHEDLLEITVKTVDEPFLSDYMVNYMKLNETSTMKGPYGVFALDLNSDKDLVFLSAGSGIAPFMSMLRYLDQHKKKQNALLIYSNKTPNEILWKEEIEQITSRNEHLNHIFTLTRYDDKTWNGKTGRISKEMILNHVKNLKDSIYYICGPHDFVSDLREMLISMDIEKESIKIEVYG